MKAYRVWVGVPMILLALWGCARWPPNAVTIIGRNFDDQVQQAQNLTFTFNKAVGPSTLTNAWDSTQYIRFIPAVAGKFRWTSPTELVFSPSVGFAAATAYRAELTDQLLRHSAAKKLTVSDEKLAFHTPYLTLTGTESWWARDTQTGRPVARLKLRFNYPVQATDVAEKLAIRIGSDDKGQPLAAQLLPTTDPTLVTVSMTDAPDANQDQPLSIRLEKGIRVPGTAYTSQEVMAQTGQLPSRQHVQVADVRPRFEANEGVVEVVTTQQLQPGNLTDFYSIQPAVETTAELTENGFIIRGAFNQTDTYVLTLTPKLKGVLGANLTDAETHDLFFGQMPASIRFVNPKAVYLSAKGAKNVGLAIVNVPKVQVSIAKVFENNMLHYLRTNRNEQYAETPTGEWKPNGNFDYQTDSDGYLSDVVVDKTVETRNLPTVRGVSALNVAIPDQAHAFRGVYVVSVGSKDEAYLNATQLVSVSDIGLITRQTPNEVLVWANAIRTAEPMPGVEVSLVSRNNQTLYTQKTDHSGLARFPNVLEKAPGFTVELITARTPDDFNFLFLPDTQVETSRFDVEGKRDNASGFDAFVYGDRDIYRPGETIHLNTIVRNPAATGQLTPAADVPLLIRLLAPNGREVVSLRKNTNAQGAVATDIPLNPAGVTGTYTVEVLNANQVLLTTKPISVEEFIPDRINVTTRTDRPAYTSGQTITASATAINLFGPPAAGRAYEMEFRLQRKPFAPKGFEAYTFEMAGEDKSPASVFPKELRQGRTNPNGQAMERFAISPLYQDLGLLEGKLYVTVFDENGRPVNRLMRFDVQTQPLFFGTRLADRYVTTNAPVAVELAAVNAAGIGVSQTTAEVSVVRFDYQTVLEKKEESIKYITRRREQPVYTNRLGFRAGKAAFRYVPTVSGEYEIRVKRPGAVRYAATSFYAYGYGSTSASSFEVSQEGQVLLTPDKPQYQPGDKARVLLKAPFDGKVLVTLERNRVLEQHWLTTQNKSAEFSFTVGRAHLPNLYVTATLIRPLDEVTLPLTVAHGFASVSVQDPATQLPVTIHAPTQSRSKTRQVIRVKTARNAQVTLAVVDEGILQIKNYTTPDPHGFFYQKRALEVGSHDLYAFLFPELSLRSGISSVGGDGYNLERRINPLSNGRVKLVALWSGILDTGSDGEADFAVDIPPFSGTLRVMAVAWKDNAFGSAAGPLKVADPVIISAGVPRFLSPGDAVDLAVNLNNTTAKPMPVTARLTLTGPLAADSLSTRQLTLPPGQESRVSFPIAARQAIGAGAIRIDVKTPTETFTDQTDLTVRPAASLQKMVQSGVVAGGKTQPLPVAGTFLPGTARRQLLLSRTPAVQYGRELSFLLGYPYGCLEQVISKAFPQLYFADLTKQLSPVTTYVQVSASDRNPNTTLRQAIQTVEGLQAPSGGFLMWPASAGNLAEDPWTSAYAVHFLSQAQQAGYAVRLATLGNALDYLTTLTNRPVTENVGVLDTDGQQIVRRMASRTNLYALYVLAAAGKPNRPAMNYYKQNLKLLTPDSRYLLAATYLRLGDTRSYQALLPKQYSDPTTDRETGGTYASPIRNLALSLDALVSTDKNNAQIPTMARQLVSGLGSTPYLTTQEAAFGFMALGKLARQTAGSTATATVSAAGKPLGNLNGPYVALTRLPMQQPLLLSAAGNGNVYYVLQTEGVPANGQMQEADNGLRIRRRLLNRQGTPITDIRQNDLVVVQLTLRSLTGLPVENVVITDLLPAGLEIENPRLTKPRDMPWIKQAATPDHIDMRDDRINLFTTATAAEQSYYYLARAVTKGTFRQGPASADAMYNPDYRSYHGAQTIRIR